MERPNLGRLAAAGVRSFVTELYGQDLHMLEHRLLPLLEKFAEAITSAGMFTPTIATSE